MPYTRYLVAYEFWTSEYSYDIVYFSKTGKGLIFFNGDISKDKNIWYRDDSEYEDVPISNVKYWAEIPKIPKNTEEHKQ